MERALNLLLLFGLLGVFGVVVARIEGAIYRRRDRRETCEQESTRGFPVIMPTSMHPRSDEGESENVVKQQ